MKSKPLIAFTLLLLAALAAHAQQTPSPATTVRDRLWIFTVYAGAREMHREGGRGLAVVLATGDEVQTSASAIHGRRIETMGV